MELKSGDCFNGLAILTEIQNIRGTGTVYSMANLCLIYDHNHQEKVSGTYKIFLLCLNNFIYLLKMSIQKWNCWGKYAQKKTVQE